jgi:hypothetical protein
LTDAPKKRNKQKPSVASRVVLAAGVLIVLALLFVVTAPSRVQQPVADFIPPEDAAATLPSSSPMDSAMDPLSEDWLHAAPVKRNNPYISNPRIGWLDRLFCEGNQTSLSCSRAPLHPLYEFYKYIRGHRRLYEAIRSDPKLASRLPADPRLWFNNDPNFVSRGSESVGGELIEHKNRFSLGQ